MKADLRIIIIDDNQINLSLLAAVTAKITPSPRVETFTSAPAALAASVTDTPDLVLVDYMMPEMDGLQFVEKFRSLKIWQDIPVIMVTADTDRSVRNRALTIGTTDFLTKPIDPSEVKARISNLLELRSSLLMLKDRNAWLDEEVAKATKKISDREEELICRLARAAEFRDPETGGHIQRMSHYSKLIASNLGLSDEECSLLLKAAPMHDVGKLGTPDAILLKPARLDDEEMAVMKRHTLIGVRILADSDSRLISLGAEVAKTHHEKWDGSGYPCGLAGVTIPLFGRIAAVADVFDALTSERPYKKAWPVEQARSLLENESGRHFDPACVQAFLRSWPEVFTIKSRFQDS